jgi:hypothetical protein
MPIITPDFVAAVTEDLSSLLHEAIDYANRFPTPYRSRIFINARGRGGHTLVEGELLDMPRIHDEVLLETASFGGLHPLAETAAKVLGEDAGSAEELRVWLRDHVAAPFLSKYFEFPEHPVRFDEGRFSDAVAELGIEPQTGRCVHIQPLTKIEVSSPVRVGADITIRGAETSELEDWLNPDSPFDTIVPQETVMEIGAVIEARYDCAAAQGQELPQIAEVRRLVLLLQLILDADAVAPFAEDRQEASGRMISAQYPGVGRPRPGHYGSLSAAHTDRLTAALQKLSMREGVVPGLSLALRRWSGAVGRDSESDKVIDFWIGLEALFTPDTDSQVKATVARRASTYLATPPERDALRQELRTSYKCRSEIVHGNQVQKWNLAAMAEQASTLLRSALLRVIEDQTTFDARAWGRKGPDLPGS